MRFYPTLKAILDRLIALLLLVGLSPLLLIIIVAIKVTSAGPVFFKQTRVGYKQSRFELLKFRTMVGHHRRTDLTELDARDPDITAVGVLLRRVKLDEIPQLINILRGEMSLIGPRPVLPQLLGELGNYSVARFDVLPGLTGLAQVSGNIHLSWPKRWKYDGFYAKNYRLSMDVMILFKTILVVVNGEESLLKRKVVSK